jgi:hypothetical protein
MADDWPEETQILTAAAGCLATAEVRDRHGEDSTGFLACVLDVNHGGDHFDATDDLWWRAATDKDRPETY